MKLAGGQAPATHCTFLLCTLCEIHLVTAHAAYDFIRLRISVQVLSFRLSECFVSKINQRISTKFYKGYCIKFYWRIEVNLQVCTRAGERIIFQKGKLEVKRGKMLNRR
jgi:hypothetical protein